MRANRQTRGVLEFKVVRASLEISSGKPAREWIARASVLYESLANRAGRLIMKLLAYIEILCMSMLVQGCSLAILAEDIEPTDVSSVKVGAPRAEVESVLGNPISSEPNKIGNIAVYSYDKGASRKPVLTGRDYLECWGVLNIFCEPILTPIALYRRQELYESQQGQLGIHYGAGDIVMDVIIGEHGLRSPFWETLSRAVCGDSDAQYRVGDAFESGRGVRASNVEAYKWYTVSASGDNLLAARVKDLLVKKMSTDQIIKAKGLVAEWETDSAACEARTASTS